jgi:hypothetical protein
MFFHFYEFSVVAVDSAVFVGNYKLFQNDTIFYIIFNFGWGIYRAFSIDKSLISGGKTNYYFACNFQIVLNWIKWSKKLKTFNMKNSMFGKIKCNHAWPTI